MFESEHLKKQVGLFTFTPSVSEWVEQTNAIGMFVKKGHYGGTFAHKDIAFELMVPGTINFNGTRFEIAKFSNNLYFIEI